MASSWACFLAVFLASLVLVVADPSHSHENPVRTAKDDEVLANAKQAKKTYCTKAKPLTPEERKEAKEELLNSMGGSNVMLEILEDSEDQDALGDEAAEKITPMWLIMRGLPCIMAFLVWFVWMFCCWSACPCCRCCRCCAKERHIPKPIKAVIPAIVAAIFVGVSACGGVAQNGYDDVAAGFETGACASARLLEDTLDGEGQWIGLLGALDVVHQVEQTLEMDSDFMTDLQSKLDDTGVVDQATYVLGQTLGLLKAGLENPANMRPTDGGTDLMHDCKLCSVAVPVIGQVQTLVEDGVGTALKNVRSEISATLSGPARQGLQDLISGNLLALGAFKDAVRDTFAFYVDVDKFDQVNKFMQDQLMYIVLFLFLLAYVLVGTGMTSGVWFTVKANRKLTADANGAPPRKNPYYTGVSKMACCTWQCSMIYMMAVLFVSGLLSAVSVPLSGMCLIMDDVDRDLMTDIGPALAINLTGDDGSMLLDMISGCIAGEPGNDDMMAMLFTRNSTNHKVSMREKLVGETKDQIDSQFNALSASMSSEDASIANSAPVQELRNFFKNNEVTSFLIANTTAMQADSTLQPMTLDSRGANGLSKGFLTSVNCNDATPTGDLSSFGTIPGIDTFVDLLEYYGSEVSYSDCAKKVTCPTGISADAQACAAGNAYIDIKRKVLDSTAYRCDVFEDPSDSSAECDVKDMTVANGVYSNDCMSSAGVMQTKSKTCSLSEFTQYMKDHDIRLKKVFERLDASVAATLGPIESDMKALVETHMLSKIENLADGISCSFLPSIYRSFVDCLCFQGVYGFRQIINAYIGGAFMVGFLAIVMYVTWRWQIDAVNGWQDAHKKSKVKPVKASDQVEEIGKAR